MAALVLTACGASSPAHVNATPTPTSTTSANAPTSTTTPTPATTATSAPTETTSTGAPTATTTGPAPTTTPPSVTGVSATATAGGLIIQVIAVPSHAAPGSVVQVTLKADESSARGALGYQLSYGDGTSSQVATPLVCTASPSPKAQAWSLSHSYASAGTYQVSATVTANCTPDHATASVPVRVG